MHCVKDRLKEKYPNGSLAGDFVGDTSGSLIGNDDLKYVQGYINNCGWILYIE